MNAAIRLICLSAALSTSIELLAQTSDYTAERARLGNERATLEAERRAAEADPEPLPEPPAAPAGLRGSAPAVALTTAPVAPQPAPDLAEPAPRAAVPATPAAAVPPGDESDAAVSRALEQLRELGELKDAGYVTDEEFERIKARILDDRF